MKYKYLLLLFSGIVLSFTACNKGNPYAFPIDGKWQETKIRLYGDSAGVKTYDTTYTKPFTAADYIQFNANGTCNISTDHYYYPNILNYPRTPQAIAVSVGTWNFSAIGASVYVLNTQTELLNPGGFNVADTVEVLSGNSLLLHVVSYSHLPGYYGVTDSYFEK